MIDERAPDAGCRPSGDARWALSFADLCLLLLGFFVLLQARGGDRAAVAQGVREAFGNHAVAVERHDLIARALFHPGEAVLRPAARARLTALARGAGSARVESVGRDPGGRRFDGWELAAARTAAVARALAAGGLAQERIAVAMPAIDGPVTGQKIAVTLR